MKLKIWDNEIIKHNLLFKYPIEIKEKLQTKYKVASSSELIDKLEQIINNSKAGEKLENIFLGDLLLSFHHPKNIKNNETGKELEKKFASIFSAKRLDDNDPYIPNITNINNKIKLNKTGQKQLIDNCKKKPDLKFDDDTMISFKSGIEKNSEVNFGSFEFLNIINDNKFKDFRVLKERKRGEKINNIKNCGLGSASLLNNTYKALKKDDLFEDFIKRFNILFSIVFNHDVFFYHKNLDNFEFWLIKHQDLKDIIIEDVRNGFKNLRWEGNSIRSRSIEKMKKKSRHIKSNFNKCLNFEFIEECFSSQNFLI